MSNRDAHRALQAWLLDTAGDGTTVPCYSCGRPLHKAAPGEGCGPDVLTIDRILPGKYGGRYEQGNVRASCAADNSGRDYREYALWVWRVAA